MDVEYASTDELIEELQKRTDHGIVSVSFAASVDDDAMNDRTVTLRRWWGDDHHCLGMACDVQSTVQQDLESYRQQYLDEQED